MALNTEMFSSNIDDNIYAGKDKTLNVNGMGVKSAQYVIQCDGIFSGDIEGHADYVPILRMETGSLRMTSYSTSGELTGDGRTVARDTIVSMEYGDWGPKIQTKLFNGENVPEMHILRLSSINAKDGANNPADIVLQDIKYENCIFKTYEQTGDVITFSFCYYILTDKRTIYGNDATQIGNSVTTYDFTTAKAAALSTG
jgi:hypothetical protein